MIRKNNRGTSHKKRIILIKELIYDLIFPKRCPICDRILRFRKEYACKTCLEKIKYIGDPFCLKCGKPLEDYREYCYDCTGRKHLYKRGAAVFKYTDMASSIYRFKYGGRQEYAEFYGRCMAQRLKRELQMWKPDAFIPVPIHSSKRKKRGYNQAELLADALAAHTGIPVCSNLIIRVKKTVPQKDLDDAGRQNNLKRAFKIAGNDVKLNTIVIIDDIYTTGSTINAMASVLHNAGIHNIYYASLAIGKGI